MKKLSLYIFLGLMFCNVGFADECIEGDACVPACPPDAIYEDEDTCIEHEGNDESVVKNYKFFGQEWDG